MKNLIISILLLLSVLFTFSSCNKDDDETTPDAPLVNTWKVTSEVYSSCDDPSNNSNSTYSCSDTECFTFTFRKDNTVRLVLIFAGATFLDIEGTYTVSGDKVNICQFDLCQEMRYQITGNTLTLTGNDEDGCDFKYTLVK
ncbi:lipocalin family protein [Fulvivirga sedimenti]|uniref:Lipocalin-like domain-containing protein n=1 Tax=Fulvivirga sedimenti TaxID=2879465 RepID=A0A9X1HR86_9BACT|nr:lipocalin family protein [Fulvivirga sedimenti]MCA6074752.1 hypothetical protein [Fulvivirga sedimenti]MCA6075929.1 hypothetical protein [Fulvivirga sedimenti]MCA6077057.1 hypothetical protein [Fulvivirga sedimenti]